MANFVPFSDGLFSALLDDPRVGGMSGLSDFAAELHRDVQEANAAVRMKWFDLWLKMGAEFDARQDAESEDFTPEELQQRMVAAVLEEIATDHNVAEKFLAVAIRALASLPDRDVKFAMLSNMMAESTQERIDG